MGQKLAHQDRNLLLGVLSDLDQFTTVRSRQTIVRNALGGLTTRDIDKRLRFLDWEGAPIEVADGLIQLFDGYEPVPGVPALGLITQAIEPLVRSAHQEQLVDLRQRMGWGTDLEPASAETWRDARPQAEVVRERIIGENTLRHIYYLHKAIEAADAVVRIEVPGKGKGTGFLVAPDLMMTNRHVIATPAQAAHAEVGFFFELDVQLHPREMEAVRTADDALLFTNAGLDISLVRLKGPPPLTRYLPIKPGSPTQNARVAIIQHPGGGVKKISIQNNLVAHADATLVQYYTSTQPGSSGSPVLDDDFAVVAIHHGAVRDENWDGDRARQVDPKQIEELQWRNQGTSMIALRNALQQQAPGLLAEMTVLES